MRTDEHSVDVFANNEKEARDEAVRGWKEGEYVDYDAALCTLIPVHSYEKEVEED
jgi:hypothetical protein